MTEILEAIKSRRSYYDISNEKVLGDGELIELIKQVTKEMPSAFNSQTQRVVVLLGEQHEKLWDLTFEVLSKKILMSNPEATHKKLNSFKKGYGTILFFEDEMSIKSYQEKYPLYASKFDTWSITANGMLQYAVWVALEAHGYGASLQHYNPLIDQDVKATFGIDENFQLLAQMPFGKPMSQPDEKSYIDQALKVRVIK